MGFKFLPGDRVQYVYAMPGYDSFPVEVLADDGGEMVTIRQGAGLFGQGAPMIEREVKRASLIWIRGSPVSQRYRAWQETISH